MNITNHEEFMKHLETNNTEFLEQYIMYDEYVARSIKIRGLCKYGEVMINPDSVIGGGLPDIRSAIDKTDYFKNMVKEKNPDFFKKYEIVGDYVDNRTHILVKDKYGLLNCLPNSILNNGKITILSAVNKTEYWIAMNREIFGDKLDYSRVKYINNSTKIELICKDCGDEFSSAPGDHIRSTYGCPNCSNKLNPSHKSNMTHKDFVGLIEVYSEEYANLLRFKTEYTTNRSQILAYDTFGLISFSPSNLIKRVKSKSFDPYKPNILGAVNKTEYALEMIKSARVDGGSEYDYSKFVYNGVHGLCDIICPVHGCFSQKFSVHIKGSGCPECCVKNGWSKSEWVYASENSNKIDSNKLYIIKCNDGNEEFYKIGITFQTLDSRFGGNNTVLLPYNYEIVKIIEHESATYIWDLEKELHRKNKEFKYVPQKEFGGMYECFSDITNNIRKELDI